MKVIPIAYMKFKVEQCPICVRELCSLQKYVYIKGIKLIMDLPNREKKEYDSHHGKQEIELFSLNILAN